MKCVISDKKKSFLTEKMFGLFFEDINYAADGGLYAEMLENRQFAFKKSTCGVADRTYDSVYAGNYGWEICGLEGRMSFHKGDALNEQNPHYMKFRVKSGKDSFKNKAYDGIFMTQHEEYKLVIWMRAEEKNEVTVSVKTRETGDCVAATSIEVRNSGKWEKYEATLTAAFDVKKGDFVVTQKEGIVDYAYISLMPAKAVAGVFRADLVEMLKDLKPGFLRFPGGCIIEGANLDNRYQWKDTLGEPWERRWNWNRWAVHDSSMGIGPSKFYSFYNQSYGLGFYEYFLLCEILGAKPLPVVNVGLACQYQSYELVPMECPEFDQYIQDALDLIEFANGDVNTKWGAVRAKMGHPAPFGLEYVGIGNEQWETEKVDFFARYKAFEKAIHAKYPDMELLGSAGPDVISDKYTGAWDYYKKECKENPKFTAAVDEHYYMPPIWFYEHLDMYDKYSRDIPVFAGEYAAHCDKLQNNMEAALAEASFMCGLERNGDVIRFASAAPLFARVGYAQWKPDYIWFNSTDVCGTPGYYVQKLFGAFTGKEAVEFKLEGVSGRVYGAVSSKDNVTYLKVINATFEEQVLESVVLEGKEIDLEKAEVHQMSAKSPAVENEVGKNCPVKLEKLENKEKSVKIPALSCTVVVITK